MLAGNNAVAAPSLPTVTQVGSDLQVRWTGNTGNWLGIDRSYPGCGSTCYESVHDGAAISEFIDTAVSPGVAYRYKVYDSTGHNGYSPALEVRDNNNNTGGGSVCADPTVSGTSITFGDGSCWYQLQNLSKQNYDVCKGHGNTISGCGSLIPGDNYLVKRFRASPWEEYPTFSFRAPNNNDDGGDGGDNSDGSSGENPKVTVNGLCTHRDGVTPVEASQDLFAQLCGYDTWVTDNANYTCPWNNGGFQCRGPENGDDPNDDNSNIDDPGSGGSSTGIGMCIGHSASNTTVDNPVPSLEPGDDGYGLDYSIVFQDEFNAPTDQWKFIDMHEGLHQAGNTGIDRDGVVGNNRSVNGKRWSAWYDQHQRNITCLQQGNLRIGGLFTNESDPTRIPYNDNGLSTQFNNHKLYTSFLSTWDRVYSNSAGGHITDPDGPNHTWGPGHYFEMSVSFAEMNTRGFRLSWYLLPAYGNASNSYDGNINNGIENDVFEYDPSPTVEHLLQMKVISNQAAGNTVGGSVDVRDHILAGQNKIGLLWMSNRFVWFVNGEEVLRDVIRVPQVPHYMVISREMNSGAKNNPSAGDLQAVPPKLPEDVGLYATNVWADRNNINNDDGVIDYVRVWSVNSGSGPGVPAVAPGAPQVTEASDSGNPRFRWTEDPIASKYTVTAGNISVTRFASEICNVDHCELQFDNRPASDWDGSWRITASNRFGANSSIGNFNSEPVDSIEGTDNWRSQSMDQIIDGFEDYAAQHGTYTVSGGGWNGGGSGWFAFDNNTMYPTSVLDVLVDGGYMENPMMDQLYRDSTSVVGDYLVYVCKDRVGLFSRHGGSENTTSSEDLQWWNDNNCPRHPLDSLNATYFKLSSPLADVSEPDTTAPVVTHQSPASMVSTGDVVVSGSAADDASILWVRAFLIGLSEGNQRYNFTTGQFSSSIAYADTVKVVTLNNRTQTGASWSYTIPNLAPGNYRLRTKVWDSIRNATAWDVRDFTVEQNEPDTTAPTVSYSSPASEASAGAVTISGSAQDESGIKLLRALLVGRDLGNQRYNFKTDQFGTSTVYADTVKPVALTDKTATSANWSFTVPNLDPGRYRLRVKVWDQLDNTSTWGIYDFDVVNNLSQRESAMRAAMGALEAYARDHGTFKVADSGWRGNGSGWFFYDAANYPNSVADALTSAGYPVIQTDPLYAHSASTQGDFLIYQCKDRAGLFSRHGTSQETTSAEDKNWWDNNGCARHPLDNLNASYFTLSQ